MDNQRPKEKPVVTKAFLSMVQCTSSGYEKVLNLFLVSGSRLQIPLRLISEHIPEETNSGHTIEVVSGGHEIYWPGLDVFVSVAKLVEVSLQSKVQEASAKPKKPLLLKIIDVLVDFHQVVHVRLSDDQVIIFDIARAREFTKIWGKSLNDVRENLEISRCGGFLFLPLTDFVITMEEILSIQALQDKNLNGKKCDDKSKILAAWISENGDLCLNISSEVNTITVPIFMVSKLCTTGLSLYDLQQNVTVNINCDAVCFKSNDVVLTVQELMDYYVKYKVFREKSKIPFVTLEQLQWFLDNPRTKLL